MAVDVIRSKKKKRLTYQFGLEFMRDDVPEVHEFTAHPRMDAGSLNYTLSASDHPERAVTGMVRAIRKMLADDDGTPQSYEPTPYEPPQPDVEPAFGDDEDRPFAGDADRDALAAEVREQTGGVFELAEPDEDGDAVQLFVGPDGEPHELADIREALKFENGSSRRRFVHLMEVDDDLTLESDQLETVFKRLIGRAGNRPTQR